MLSKPDDWKFNYTNFKRSLGIGEKAIRSILKKLEELKYLKILSKQYPSISKASTEIINLEAILNLPKGTEHFISDIHGEYEAFVHVLKNGSGVIKRKIEELFNVNEIPWSKSEDIYIDTENIFLINCNN